MWLFSGLLAMLSIPFCQAFVDVTNPKSSRYFYYLLVFLNLGFFLDLDRF